MTDNNDWITIPDKKYTKHISTINFFDPVKNPTKLELSPSSFPNSCICGHLHEFRGINFCPTYLPGTDVAKIKAVNIKLRSFP